MMSKVLACLKTMPRSGTNRGGKSWRDKNGMKMFLCLWMLAVLQQIVNIN